MAASATASLSDRLLGWYRRHARALPWRAPPGSRPAPPYRVWLAEVMLQQTTVAAAGPRYQRFLDRFPTIAALAAAPVDDVLAEWAGLGYYARARNLHACAQAVVEMGGFPETEGQLRQLPGVGDYTAAAVAAIAFGEAVVPVDANILRVGSRLFAVDSPPARARGEVRAALAAHVPAAHPGDFAQALMDLGAGICTPRRPDCAVCPLQPDCAAARLGTPEAFPARAPRVQRIARQGTLWWLRHGARVGLVRRPPTGLLGGLLALPGTDWSADGRTDRPPPVAVRAAPIAVSVTHEFTHFPLSLGVMAVQLPTASAALAGEPLIWTPADELESIGLPGLYLKAVRAILAAGG